MSLLVYVIPLTSIAYKYVQMSLNTRRSNIYIYIFVKAESAIRGRKVSKHTFRGPILILKNNLDSTVSILCLVGRGFRILFAVIPFSRQYLYRSKVNENKPPILIVIQRFFRRYIISRI